MPLEGLVDKAAERERLDKELAKVRAEIETVRRKLGNDSFVNGAPPAVVAEHRKREAISSRVWRSCSSCATRCSGLRASPLRDKLGALSFRPQWRNL